MGPLNELPLSTHTVVSLSALGHGRTPRFKLTCTPETWQMRAIVPLFVVKMFLQLKTVTSATPLSQLRRSCSMRKNKKSPASAAGAVFVLAGGIEWVLESVWFLMDGDVSRLALSLCALAGPNPGPRRPQAVSFIQFHWLQTGNEGFRGHW